MRRHTSAPLPPNLGGGEIWGGMIKIRNAIEAGGVAFLFFIIHTLIKPFMPVGSIIPTIICFIIAIPIGLIALCGVNGEPLSAFVLNVFNYSNTRTYVTLRPPMPITEKKKEVVSEKSSFDKFMLSLFRK